jgi:hypothetical protein
MDLPNLDCVTSHPVLRLKPAGSSRHIPIRRMSPVLLSKGEVPWARLLDVITLSDGILWAVVRLLWLADPQFQLCRHTGVPIVVSTDESDDTDVILVPARWVLHPIRLIPVPITDEDENLSKYWVNWWISTGNCYYDEDQRLSYLQKHDLCN